MSEEVHDLVPVGASNAAIVEADPRLVVAAFTNYQRVQSALDEAMPGCIMKIKGKPFRKKQYWRAIATAFNLHLELVSEQRVIIEDVPISPKIERDDWGYIVVYRATAGNARSCDGDGSCYASEKLDKFDKATAMMTEHNVRAHAHTRAKNRAIADLVGFGEVSAEEMTYEAPPKQQRQTRTRAHDADAPGPLPLTDEQVTKLGDLVSGQASTMLDRAHQQELNSAPQDEASMEDAIKKVASKSLGIPKATYGSFDVFMDMINRVGMDDNGKVIIVEVGA